MNVITTKTVRDMTKAQFNEALDRNNFTRPVLFWCEDKENPGHSYGIIYYKGRGTHRRQTIAHLLESRRQTNKRKAEQPSPLDRVYTAEEKRDLSAANRMLAQAMGAR